MTPLFTFGICVAIAIALVLLFMIILGSNSLLLIIIFPALLAEKVTGERGLDFSRKSFIYLIFLWIFVLVEILLIASIFFGLYSLFFGYPVGVAITGQQPITSEDIYRMLLINKTLLALDIYFIIQFVYYSIKHRERFKQFNRLQYFLYRMLPLISLPIAIIYLLNSHSYLLKYPNSDSISITILILSYTYVIYLLYSLVRSIISYVRIFSHGLTTMPFQFWFSNAIGLFYNGLFIYFFYQLKMVW